MALLASEPTSAIEQQKMRHDHYKKLGAAFKEVRDESLSNSPDMAKLKHAAAFVTEASMDQGRWFPKGSGPEAGRTRALAVIWSKPEDFLAAQKLFSAAAPKLQAAADSGDVAAVRSSFGEVGKTCKNCHDNFRTPDEK